MSLHETFAKDIRDKIEKVQRQLDDLKSPPKQFENTAFEVVLAACDRHGEFEQRCRTMRSPLPGGNGITTKSECPTCLAERLRELQRDEADMEKRRMESNISRLMMDLNLPQRFAHATLDNYEAVNPEAARCLKLCKAYAAKWPDRRKQGGGLVMCGKPGTGKNHLALAIAQHVINEHQHGAMFTTALRVARAFKSTWGKNAERTEYDVIHAYTDPDLLIIDEVGVQFGSESEKLILFEVINTRYEQMKPTILISNLPLEELSAFIGERVIDRMNDGGGCTLAFTWDSYRSRGGA